MFKGYRYPIIGFMLLVLLIAALQLPIILPCSNAFLDQPHPVIMTAFYTETEAITNLSERVHTCSRGDEFYSVWDYQSTQFVLVETGVGPDAARTTTQRIFTDLTNVEVAVFSGIAGGLSPDAYIGQVVVAKNWHLRDTKDSAAVNLELIELATTMTSEVTVVENGVTSYEFVSNMFIGDQLYLDYDAYIVEMETFEVAKIAASQEIPFIAFRTISDLVGSTAEMQYQSAANRSAALALEFIHLVHQTPKEAISVP